MDLAREVVYVYQDGFFDLDPREHEEIQNMEDGVKKQAAMAQITKYLDVMAWQTAAPTSALVELG